MYNSKRIFLELSSELTGYSVIDLEGTGLAPTYIQLMEHEIGKGVTQLLYDTMHRILTEKKHTKEYAMKVNIIASPLLWPVCQSLIVLWYQGQWNRMTANWYKYYANMAPPKSIMVPNIALGQSLVPSAASYTEQLSYKAAGAHPPGAHPTGFGSWALDPVFGDFANDN